MALEITKYRYKWVSALLCGEPDMGAAKKAIKAGWEPVDVIPPEIEPLTGLTMEQTLRSMALYRMSEEAAQQRSAYYADLNARTLAMPAETYLRKSNQLMPKFAAIDEPSFRVIAEPLSEQLKQYFSPEMLARYPDRQKELDDYAAGPKNKWLLQAIKDYEELNATKIADKPISS